jgi:hypothetical protein
MVYISHFQLVCFLVLLLPLASLAPGNSDRAQGNTTCTHTQNRNEGHQDSILYSHCLRRVELAAMFAPLILAVQVPMQNGRAESKTVGVCVKPRRAGQN